MKILQILGKLDMLNENQLSLQKSFTERAQEPIHTSYKLLSILNIYTVEIYPFFIHYQWEYGIIIDIAVEKCKCHKAKRRQGEATHTHTRTLSARKPVTHSHQSICIEIYALICIHIHARKHTHNCAHLALLSGFVFNFFQFRIFSRWRPYHSQRDADKTNTHTFSYIHIHELTFKISYSPQFAKTLCNGISLGNSLADSSSAWAIL